MKLLSLLAGLVVFASLANAQEIVTLTAGPWEGTNYTETELTIDADQAVEVLGINPATSSGSLVEVY